MTTSGRPADPGLSVPPVLDHNGPRHNVVHSPVVLEEEERDEDGKEERDGEVLIERPHRGPAGETEQEVTGTFAPPLDQVFAHFPASNTHAERETLEAGTTRTRLGRTSVDVSHVTTRRPSRNFPGVAPPAPQIQSV